VPEPFLGEKVCAVIVLRPGRQANAAWLRSFCRQRLADIKIPSAFRFVDEIPKGPTGKILKRLLREQVAADVSNERRTARSVTRAEARQWIDEWLTANLGSRSGSDVDNVAFAELGMDSLQGVQLAHELSEWLGYELGVTVSWNFPTAAALADHLAAGRGPQTESDLPAGFLSNEAAEAMLSAELEGLNINH
jgi:acyl carrier protein